VTAPVPPVLAAQLGLPDGFGLVVQDVMPDSPAAKAGIQKYDILKRLNDQQLVQESQLATLLAAIGKDTEVSLTVIRKGQEQKVTAKPEQRLLPAIDRREYRLFNSGGGPRPDAEDMRRQAEEMRRAMEQKARALQERMRQERQSSPGTPRGADASPERLLRDLKDAAGSQMRVETQSSTTTVDGTKARLRLKDNTGEIEVAAEKGQRILTAKDADGKVVFTGPVNTPEERAAVPEQFRKKLEKIQVRQDGNNSISISGSTGSTSSAEARGGFGSFGAAEGFGTGGGFGGQPGEPRPENDGPETQGPSEQQFQ